MSYKLQKIKCIRMILCVLFLKDKQGLKILVKYKLISHTVRERMYSNKKTE